MSPDVYDWLNEEENFFLPCISSYQGTPPPPRPLDEAGVRKHWSTKYKDFYYIIVHYKNILNHPKLNILPPLPSTWGRASIFMYYIR